MAADQPEEAWKILIALIKSALQADVVEAAVAKYYALSAKLNKTGEAMRDLESEFASRLNDLRFARGLADFYSFANETNKELQLRERMAEQDPDLRNLALLTSTYARQSNFVAAARIAGISSALDQRNANQYRCIQAYFQMKAGNAQSAWQQCKGLLQDERSDAQVLLRVGRLLSDMGKNEDSLTAFRLGEERANEQFRKERCALEACRIEMRLGRASQSTQELLEKLSQNALAGGVRTDAKSLLATFDSRRKSP